MGEEASTKDLSLASPSSIAISPLLDTLRVRDQAVVLPDHISALVPEAELNAELQRAQRIVSSAKNACLQLLYYGHFGLLRLRYF